ncbi:MAG: hypothetical protein HFI68_07815 [Lachnospiraceae bacterium]|nr:hypothetical protein [Lachnospiraceae bacterium]
MIKKQIIKLYHKVSGLAVVHMAVCVYNHGTFWSNFASYLRLKKTAKKLNQQSFDKINTIFICQNISVWSKVRPVYEQMKRDGRFRVWIVAVADLIDKNGENGALKYLTGLGYEDVINADTGGGWFDLRTLHPYYVFLPKPYEQYMPPQYQSKVISSYSKICYLLYGLETTKVIIPFTYSRLFFRNVTVYLAENKYYARFNQKRMAWSHRKKVRRSLNLGYPAFETVSQLKQEPHDPPLRVLWTPRWSEDKEVGGGNFIRYKDEMPDFIESHEEMAMTFRPHPMTFYHFVSVKRMTEEDVAAYKKRYQESERLRIDETPNYLEAFKWSDVLVSDTSSLVIEYACLKKPQIFCNTGCKNSPDMDILTKGFYIADSMEDVKKYLLMLSRGEDPLKEKRIQICDEMFGNNIVNTSRRITEALAREFARGRE